MKFLSNEAHLWEEGPLVLGLLDAVGHQPLHGFGGALIQLAEVGRHVSPADHEDNLSRESERNIKYLQMFFFWF